MYPVVFRGWLRLRVALAAFLAGGISYPVFSGLGQVSSWYDQVPLVLMFGGAFYLHFVGEWMRILYKKRKAPETRRRVVRLGTLLFFIGFIAPLAFVLSSLGILLAQSILSTAILTLARLMLGTGTIIITLGIFENWKNLPVKVETSARNALRMMKEAGSEIHDDPLWIGLDPTLRFAAYTYPADEGSVILVSPWYVETKWFGGLDNLLVHEMSHIYRRENNNPSVIRRLTDLDYYQTIEKYSRKSYKRKILVEASYTLGEVPTDDLAFRVLEKCKVSWIDSTGESLQTLVKAKPIWALGAGRRRWKNALRIVDNSRFIAIMERHKIPDRGDKAKMSNLRLLSSFPKEAQKAYDYFHQLALDFGEDITEEEFRNLLGDYLSRFDQLAEEQLRSL